MRRSQRRAKRLTSSLKQFRIPIWVYGAGLAGLLLVILATWISSWSIRVLHDYINLQSSSTATVKDKFDASLEIAKTIAGSIGTIATIGGGAFVFWNIRLTQSRLITERFSKAVEQLASDKIEVRLGGIYALERIAYDSSRDHWTIMEVLSAFVREKSPIKALSEDEIRAKAYEIWKNDDRWTDAENWEDARRELSQVPQDIQAALTVIGRRKHENDPPGKRIDLHSINLSYADFRGANLSGAFLSNADLSGANLRESDLKGAAIVNANLNRVRLGGANLSGADFNGANLIDADLSYANFNRTTLICANLNGAVFIYATLNGADLYGASLRKANFCNATLVGTDLSRTTLSGAFFLDSTFNNTKLSGAILFDVDLSTCKGLTQQSFEGEDPPRLYKVTLPEGITVDPDRDCDWLRSKGFPVPNTQ